MSNVPGSYNAPDIPSPIAQPGKAPMSPYPPIIIQAHRSWFSRFVTWLGWSGFMLCALLLMSTWATMGEYFDTSGGITEKYVSGEKFAQNKIAVITISGAIMQGDGFVKKQIDRIREDKNVKGVVVRIDSPGGTVTGSDYIYHHLKKLREEKLKTESAFPLVVSMGSIAASGGYYIAMAVGDQEKSIFAEPTTTTGSIGVIIPHYDITGLMEEYHIKDDSIATHPRKQMLSMTKQLSKEDREILTAYINESFTRFKDIIKDGRPHFKKDEDALTQLATGEVFTANQAKKSGLIDEIGFLEDAIARATELASLDASQTRVVKFESPLGLFGDLGIASETMRAPAITMQTLADLSTPKAYYLWTSLPLLVTTRE